MDKTQVKNQLINYVDELEPELIELSEYIYHNPELNFEEFKAATALTKILKKHGLEVTRPYGGLETAFMAEYKQGNGPKVAILCEYDALSIGHACGHNLIASGGIGAGLAVVETLRKNPQLQGHVQIIGTPAEEGGGGKIILQENGVFADQDALFLMHPTSGITKVAGRCKSSYSYLVTYRGQKAHASSHPDKGHNSQDACVICYTAVGCLRYMVKPDVAIYTLITEGNNNDGYIPEESKMQIRIKTFSQKSLEDAKAKVENCIKAGAIGAGCEYDIEIEEGYLGRVVNKTLGQLLRDNLTLINEPIMDGFVDDLGGEDFGNLSRVIPGMMVYPTLLPEEKISGHTERFRQLANSPRSHEVIKIGAKSMALSTIDIFFEPEIIDEAKKELEKLQKSGDF